LLMSEYGIPSISFFASVLCIIVLYTQEGT
jgi:hypothetical protein